MIEKREGKEARTKELTMHLQLAYRFWQRNKLETFHAELISATTLANNMKDSSEVAPIQSYIQAAKAAAKENNAQGVATELGKAIALSERMIRLQR